MTNEIKGHGGHASEDQPRCDGVMDFTSIQKAILSAIDLSKIDRALTGETDEERNAELERRVKEFFSQLVVEFQGKGDGRYEFGGRINRTVQGFIANTVLEIERLTKRVAELEDQLRKADDKSREELSSQLDPLRKHEAQMMKYVKEYAYLARTRDWETLRRVFNAPAPEERRREVAERFAARRNTEQEEINRVYRAHANALSKLRDAKKFGLKNKDLNDDLLRPIDVASWWANARERKEAEEAKKSQASVDGGDAGVTPVDGEGPRDLSLGFDLDNPDADPSLTDEDGSSELINLDWKEDMIRRSLR